MKGAVFSFIAYNYALQDCVFTQEKNQKCNGSRVKPHVCLLQGGSSNSGFSADHVTVTCPVALPVFAHWVIRWAAVCRHRWRGWAADFVLLHAAFVVLAAVCVRKRATQFFIKRLSLDCQCCCRKTSRFFKKNN